MTVSPTPTLDEITQDAIRDTARKFRAIVDAGKPGLSLALIAAAVDRDPSTAEQWANGGKPLPVWALVHRYTPRSVKAAMCAWIAASLQTNVAPTTSEEATAKLLRLMGDLLARVGPMFSDGVIDHAEQRVLIPLIEALYQACADWLAQHGHSTATNKGPNEDK